MTEVVERPGDDWWHGLMPALVTPFDARGEIDAEGLRRHVGRVAGVQGVVAVVALGHAGEILALSRQERRTVTELVRAVAPSHVKVVAGIEGATGVDLGRGAEEAMHAGADAVLVLPPFDRRPFRHLAKVPAVVTATFETIYKQSGAPMIVFQYPDASGCSYSVDALDALADLAGVVAVKAATGNVGQFAQLYRQLRARVGVLAAGDSPALLGMMLSGCDGVLAGISTIGTEVWAQVLADVWEHREAAAVRTFFERCAPLTSSIYEDQLHLSEVSTFAATKEALFQLGEIDSPWSRPPSVMPGEERRAKIASALRAANLVANRVSEFNAEEALLGVGSRPRS